MGLHGITSQQRNQQAPLFRFQQNLGAGHFHCKEQRKTHVPRNPENTPLHKVIREHLNTFYSEVAANPNHRTLPFYVKNEFQRYLECGVLAHGFLRLKCDDCRKEKLVAFSCKGRGFCPSCGGRRQAETSNYLMDSVLPQVPVRQWVLSFPFPIRFLLATSGKHTNKVLRITQKVLSEFLKKKSGLANAKTAAVTLVQRFGSSLNLNIHFHILVPDGVFVQAQEKTQLEIFPQLPTKNKKLTFMPNQPPTNDEVEMLVGRIHDRVLKYFKRQGYFKDGHESDPAATEDGTTSFRPTFRS